MVVLSIRLDSLIAKFKEGRERSERLMYEQSHRDYLRSGYLHHRLPVAGAVNHYRDNAITYKAQRDKNARELKLANAAITDMQMRQRDVAALDAKYIEGVSWMLKLKMMLCVMMLLVVVGCTSKQSVSQCVKLPGFPPPAWIMQPPRLADTAERDYFTFREADHFAKTTEGTQKYINEQVDRARLAIDGQLMQLLCVSTYTRFQRSINA